MSQLILTTEVRHFKLSDASGMSGMLKSGASIIAKTTQPSLPSGGWPGNIVTIRSWQIHEPGQRYANFREATKEEILHLEKILGEWESPKVVKHRTVGLVAISSHESHLGRIKPRA